MSMQSANLAQMDALWRAYVNADPDLRRLECRKQAIAHRRIRKEHAQRVRAEAGREILQTLTRVAGMVGIIVLGLALFALLIWLDARR